jgi:hypothetical protein
MHAGQPTGNSGGLSVSVARRLAGALALALAATLSACGGHGGAGGRAGAMPASTVSGSSGAHATPVAVGMVRAAAAATLARTAAVQFTLEGSQALGSSRAPVLGSGEFDFRSGVGSEAIDLGEVGRQEPGNEHVVFLPSRVYVQPKASARTVMPKGKAWVAATLTGPDSVNTNFPLFVLQIGRQSSASAHGAQRRFDLGHRRRSGGDRWRTRTGIRRHDRPHPRAECVERAHRPRLWSGNSIGARRAGRCRAR